jgi:imidazolonepropionase-like amidohydrolase
MISVTGGHGDSANSMPRNSPTEEMRAIIDAAHGRRVALGNDTGVSKRGDNATQFVLLVRNGLTPSQAIAAATVGAADLLGRDDIGTRAPARPPTSSRRPARRCRTSRASNM